MRLKRAAVFILAFANFCYLMNANPVVGLFDPKCTIVYGDCPNENVTFWLYTNDTQNTPLQLDPLKLNPWDFQPRRPIKILIHGYTGHRDFAPNTQIRPALLEHDDVYVISIDYGNLVPLPCYFSAVENLPLASKCLGQLINNLVGQSIVQNEDIHLIGFSLGAQVAGQTANYLKHKLKRITGLDPAKPMFITVGSERKLDPTDAEFVDVIHTDVLGRGMLRSMGHADFYPNLGPYQPGCQDVDGEDPGSCNHERAPRYYAESIHSSHGFWGFPCPTWLHYIFGLCGDSNDDALMGYFIKRSTLGSYFLSTANRTPFALGPLAKPKLIAGSYGANKNYYNVTPVDFGDFEPQLYKAFEEWVIDEELETPREVD